MTEPFTTRDPYMNPVLESVSRVSISLTGRPDNLVEAYMPAMSYLDKRRRGASAPVRALPGIIRLSSKGPFASDQEMIDHEPSRGLLVIFQPVGARVAPPLLGVYFTRLGITVPTVLDATDITNLIPVTAPSPHGDMAALRIRWSKGRKGGEAVFSLPYAATVDRDAATRERDAFADAWATATGQPLPAQAATPSPAPMAAPPQASRGPEPVALTKNNTGTDTRAPAGPAPAPRPRPQLSRRNRITIGAVAALVLLSVTLRLTNSDDNDPAAFPASPSVGQQATATAPPPTYYSPAPTTPVFTTQAPATQAPSTVAQAGAYQPTVGDCYGAIDEVTYAVEPLDCADPNAVLYANEVIPDVARVLSEDRSFCSTVMASTPVVWFDADGQQALYDAPGQGSQAGPDDPGTLVCLQFNF